MTPSKFYVVSGRASFCLEFYVRSIDNAIDDLRHSGCGLHIGSYFAGCVVYADDIMLLSCNVWLTFAWIRERGGIYVLALVKLSVSLLVVTILKHLI